MFVASPDVAKSLGGFPKSGQVVPMLFRTIDYAPRQQVERYLVERGVRPVTVAESEDTDLLQTLARRGRGVVALPAPAIKRDLSSGALVRIGPAKTGLLHEIWVIVPSAEPVDPVLKEAVAAALSAKI